MGSAERDKTANRRHTCHAFTRCLAPTACPLFVAEKHLRAYNEKTPPLVSFRIASGLRDSDRPRVWRGGYKIVTAAPHLPLRWKTRSTAVSNITPIPITQTPSDVWNGPWRFIPDARYDARLPGGSQLRLQVQTPLTPRLKHDAVTHSPSQQQLPPQPQAVPGAQTISGSAAPRQMRSSAHTPQCQQCRAGAVHVRNSQ